MGKTLALLLCFAMLLSVTACGGGDTASQSPSQSAQTLTGTGKGFGGPLTVTVTLEGDTITAVEVTEQNETPNVAGDALTQIPAAIVEANSADVDAVSGATVTSNAIMYAVKNALDPEANPAPVEEEPEEAPPAEIAAAEAYMGFGLANTVRMGPGSDDTGTPVYSINQVFANVLFDGEGKILNLYVDQLEYATPNYDGASMPHFTGWPGQSYNNDENHDAVVDGTLTATEESFTAEVDGWATKRDRGTDYVMGTGSWFEQMDAFQELFVGMTVDEVEEWFQKYCSDANGRPLQESSSGEGDAEKYAALTDEEKAMLADVTSSATMSLQDAHGDLLSAIRDSYENRINVNLTLG